jgi:hypothetical protein
MADYLRRLGALETRLGGAGSCQICELGRTLRREGEPPVRCDGVSCTLTFADFLASLGNDQATGHAAAEAKPE